MTQNCIIAKKSELDPKSHKKVDIRVETRLARSVIRVCGPKSMNCEKSGLDPKRDQKVNIRAEGGNLGASAALNPKRE